MTYLCACIMIIIIFQKYGSVCFGILDGQQMDVNLIGGKTFIKQKKYDNEVNFCNFV